MVGDRFSKRVGVRFLKSTIDQKHSYNRSLSCQRSFQRNGLFTDMLEITEKAERGKTGDWRVLITRREICPHDFRIGDRSGM